MASGGLTFGGNGTLRTTVDITTTRNYAIASGVTGTIETDDATTLTHNGVISGAGNLNKAGTEPFCWREPTPSRA